MIILIKTQKKQIDLFLSSNFLYQCKMSLHYFFCQIQANLRYENSPVFKYNDPVEK